MNKYLKKTYLLANLLQRIGILSLLLLYACDCKNAHQPPIHTDGLSTPETNTKERIEMHVTPTQLVGEQRQAKLSLTIPKHIPMRELKNYQLKITYTPTPTTSTSEISYVDFTGNQITKNQIHEKITHFVNDESLAASRTYELFFTFVPDSNALQAVVKFELLDTKDQVIVSGQTTWKDQIPKLEMVLQGKPKLTGDERDFSLTITNAGAKATAPNQLKLVITRTSGNKATVGTDDQHPQLQEIVLEALNPTSSITKQFKVYPDTDTKTSFSFQLIYIGADVQEPVTISWQESRLEISQLYRQGQQVYYQISNYGALEKDAVELVYKNLNNNKVALAGLVQQSIDLGKLGNLSHPYSGLQIDFDGESGAEFEFQLIEKGKVVETKIIKLQDIKIQIGGIRDGQTLQGVTPVMFYVENMNNLPLNIEDIYIQATSDHGVELKWSNNEDTKLGISLAAYTGKTALQAGERLSLQLELKDAHGEAHASITLAIQERSNNRERELKQISLNWKR